MGGIRRVFIGNLPSSARERDLKELLQRYNPQDFIITTKGYAFVDFATPDDAEDVVFKYQHSILHDQRLNFELGKSNPRGDPPSRSSNNNSSVIVNSGTMMPAGMRYPTATTSAESYDTGAPMVRGGMGFDERATAQSNYNNSNNGRYRDSDRQGDTGRDRDRNREPRRRDARGRDENGNRSSRRDNNNNSGGGGGSGNSYITEAVPLRVTRRVVVDGLRGNDVTGEEVAQWFNDKGLNVNYVSVHLRRDGQALVEFSELSDAPLAAKLNGQEMLGANVRIQEDLGPISRKGIRRELIAKAAAENTDQHEQKEAEMKTD